MRETRAGAGLDTLWQDLRFGARLLRRSPLFTFTALLSLAIGIGATTTIFSLVNALLLRDVQVAAPRQLVELWRTTQFGSGTAFSYPDVRTVPRRKHRVQRRAGDVENPMAGSTGSGSRAAGRLVSGNFFDVLGLTPLAGRLLSPRDDRPDAPEGSAVAVLSHRFWVREFGGSADALGRTIRIGAVPFTIVGIAPAGFDDLAVGRPADFFVPMGSEPLVRQNSLLRSPPSNWLGIVGRLKPGITSEAARGQPGADLRAVHGGHGQGVPDPEAQQRLRAQRLFVQSASNGVSDLRRDFSRPLLLLMGAVALVLVIACTNVVNLLLSRGVARRREIALRLAIGAGRSRVVRQLLTESALLGAMGAALGLIVAAWGAPLALSLVTQGGTPIDLDVAPDRRVLFFTAAVAMGAVSARGRLSRASHGSRRSHAGLSGQSAIPVGDARVDALGPRADRGAGSAVAAARRRRVSPPRHASQHSRIPSGLRGRAGGSSHVDPSRVGYTGERLTQYYRDVLTLVRTVPGVRAASLSKITPISGGGIDLPITIEGRPREPGVMVNANRMSEGFFATMTIPMLLGRDFVPEDAGRGRVIVNEALVQRYFKDENPIGRRFMLMGPMPLEIVGVVGELQVLHIARSR